MTPNIVLFPYCILTTSRHIQEFRAVTNDEITYGKEDALP